MALTLLTTQFSQAQNGLLGVAVSPDGKTVAVGGSTRVVYVLNSDDLAVRKKLWIKANVRAFAFCKDGSQLTVHDDGKRLHLLDTKDFAIQQTIKIQDKAAFAPQVDLMAAVVGSWYSKPGISVLSMKDGRVVKFLPIDKSLRPAVFGFDASGSKLVFLSGGEKNSEKRHSGSTPREIDGKKLSNLERAEFRQKHDGRGSKLFVFDIKSGKLEQQTDLWITAEGRVKMQIWNDSAYLVNYNDYNVRVPLKGDAKASLEFFRIGNFAYGAGFSPDGQKVITGSLCNGRMMSLKDKRTTPFKIDSLPGFPEYFQGFAVGPDGTVFGITSAFRAVKIAPQGNVTKIAPVF